MRIALFGLGIIGPIWARHWQADGHDVRVWNRTPKPDVAGWTADACAAAQDAELVAITVADGPAALGIVERIAPVLRPGVVVANHSTIGVDETRLLAERVRATGAVFLDLPFVGSKPAAEKRQHVFYLGDDDGSFARVEPAYRAIAKVVLPIGGVGQAMALKLGLNLLVAGSYQALAESLHLVRVAGLDTECFFAVLDQHVCRSGLTELKRPLLTSGDYAPQFSVRNLHKDLRLALGMAAGFGQELPMARSVAASYAEAEGRGMGERDFAALIEVLTP